MAEFVSKLNFDTDFCVPEDCLHKGDVSCKIVAADCKVIDRWDEMLTFRVRLILRITIKRGELRCSFEKEVVLKESVWFDGCFDLLDCDVKAAVCKCVVNHHLVWCNGTVAVHFEFQRPKPFCPCPPRQHHRCDHHCDRCDHHCDRCDHHCDCCGCRKPCDCHTFSCKPKRVGRH